MHFSNQRKNLILRFSTHVNQTQVRKNQTILLRLKKPIIQALPQRNLHRSRQHQKETLSL